MEPEQGQNEKKAAALNSVGAAVLLTGLKLAVGIPSADGRFVTAVCIK